MFKKKFSATAAAAVSVLLVMVTCVINCNSKPERILSRKKRVLMFPEGSSFSVALCSTSQMILPGKGIFSEAVNWGVNYNLPDNISEFTELSDYFRKKGTHGVARRNRRDLYQNIENVMYSMGYDGKSCIYRALCQASKQLVPKEDNIIKEMARVLFQYPLERLSADEPEEHRLYHRASRLGHEKQDCDLMFSECPFSLLDLALGLYSIPPGYFN